MASGIKDIKTRLFDKIKKTDDCWIWIGATVCGKPVLGIWNAKTCTQSNKSARRLLYQILTGTPPNRYIWSTCGKKDCVNPKHFVMRGENGYLDNTKKRRLNKSNFGEQNRAAKLTDEKVIAIRKDNRTHREIAEEYGVTIPTISAVKRRITWKHLK